MTSLEDLAHLMSRRAAGEWAALDGHWADAVAIWHCYDDRTISVPGALREGSSGRELAGFAGALTDFSRRSDFHVSPSTSTIVETSRWSGEMKSGERVENATCVVYTVVAGKIARLDVYDDSNRSRVFAELLVHHLVDMGAPA